MTEFGMITRVEEHISRLSAMAPNWYRGHGPSATQIFQIPLHKSAYAHTIWCTVTEFYRWTKLEEGRLTTMSTVPQTVWALGPKVFGAPTYANTVWPVVTKFGTITHVRNRHVLRVDMLHSPKQCGTSAPIFGDLPTYTPFCVQTLVKYTDKVSIKLQLLKQSVNYSYNSGKRKPIKLQLHKVKPGIMGHLCIYFFHSKINVDHLAIKL